ncbi:hypothetical protein D7X74_40670 [Corallococcus sp. CA047B]|uniref:hypothetical protein n=1 Tax=Corallococcus sp. CA047B TaxID=2316729 RepID=UPI000EA0ABE4|nr:hypothetical protein [Corallococcus sp. CA047B]RKG97786.1 hypothetical protein D7X74_40670 [Corallococcus sp. CA047B]
MSRGLAAALVAMLAGCVAPSKAWKTPIEWPDANSAMLVGQPMEAGAAVAAAGAVRELVRTNTDPTLFEGCASPEQGLMVAVFTGPTTGLYYVVVHQDFRRCGGPRIRVLDAWDAYAVTPQGDVVAKAPPPAGDSSFSAPRLEEPVPSVPPSDPLPPPLPPPAPVNESPAPAPVP